MTLKNTLAVVIATTTLGVSAQFAAAQVPGGLGSRLSGGASGSAEGSAAVDRAQAKIKQRVQAQVQQRVQAQVQQRLQTQVQARVNAEARRAAEIAQRAALRAEARVNAAKSNLPGEVRVGAGVNANTRTNARVGNTQLQARGRTRAGADARLTLPPGITEADVQIYDNIFGQFNPLRQRQRNNNGDQASEQAQRRGGPVASEADRPQQEEAEQSQRQGLGLVDAKLDLATRIAVAARQRRATIAHMRDQAVATGNAKLLAQADEMEHRLDAFVQAQAEIKAAMRSNANLK